MDASAINLIQTTALDAARAHLPAALTHRLAALPEGYKLHDLERYQQTRERFRGKMETTALAEFIRYVKEIAGSGSAQVFIDPHVPQARAFFNLGSPEAPGHGDHIADLKLNHSPEWQSLHEAVEENLNQKQLIEWLQDWGPNITALAAGLEKEIPAAQAIAALREVTIKETREETSAQHDFRATKSAMDDVEAKSRVGLPGGFRFAAVPCEGISPKQLILRLSVLTGSTNPIFRLRPQRFAAVEQAVQTEFRDVLAQNLGGSAKLTIGTFTP